MFIKTLAGVVFSTVILTGITQAQPAAPRPNVLYIYADDLGWGSFRANAQSETLTKTPTIDALASGGINFRRAYGCMACSPARSSQQTGFHQGHTWTDRNDPSASKAIRADDITIGDMLNQAGYRVAYYGKWGYGADAKLIDPKINNVQTLPINHGYTDILAELHHMRAHTFFQPSLWFNNIDTHGTNTVLKYNANDGGNKIEYVDDLYAEAAEKFIRTHANGPKPFFCEVAFQVPHTPLPHITKMENWFADYKDVDTSEWPEAVKQYAAMIARQDHHVANLLATLDDPNGDGNTNDSVRANTLVIFASDNGGQWGIPHDFLFTNGNLDGTKDTIKEGGIRVPTFFNWQGTIPAGQTSDYITCVSDVLPTLCELAGVIPPMGIDGVSIAPLLTGKGQQRPRPWLAHESGTTWSIIRNDGIKLRGNQQGEINLFYLQDGSNTDYEQVDLTTLTSDPKHSIYQQWKKELHAVAIAERLEEPVGFANTYHRWVGDSNGHVSEAANWSDYDYSNAGICHLSDKGAPRESWIALLANTTDKNQTAVIDTDIRTLGFEIAGNPDKKVEQKVTVGKGKTLTGRNEIRLSPFATVELNGGTLASTRWVDLFDGAVINGTGTIDTSLYNAGTVQTTPAGGITINGDYYQTASGALHLFSGKQNPLIIKGTATLDGTLRLVIKNPLKKRFKILSANSITGKFNNPDDIVKSGSHQFRIVYKANTVELEPMASSTKKTAAR